MAQTQKTIRFNQRSDELVQQISPNHSEPNYNFSINQLIHRYDVLTKHLLPEFESGEFKAICQAYNGHAFNSDIELEARAFGWTMREAIQYDENVLVLLGNDPLRTKFKEFIEKVDALTIPQIIATLQAVHAVDGA